MSVHQQPHPPHTCTRRSLRCCKRAGLDYSFCVQMKKARVGASPQKTKAAPATAASAGGGILIDSDPDDGVPARQATGRFGGRRLQLGSTGERSSLVIGQLCGQDLVSLRRRAELSPFITTEQGATCPRSHGIFRGGIVLMQGRCSQGHRSIPHRRQAAGDPGQEDSMLSTRDQVDFEDF